MYYKSKKVSLIILATTSIVFTGIVFLLFSNPENKTFIGPISVAILTYILSLAFYIFDPETQPQDFGKQIDDVGVSVFQHLSLLQLTKGKRLFFAILLQL